jgi:hypothetical protein
MRARPHHIVVVLVAITVAAATGQAPTTGLDRATIGRIRAEALDRSQAMEHVWWLAEVHGPRATGTPALEAASKWAMDRFREWGLSNVHQERFPFGQGWTIERFSAHLVEPQTQALVGQPRWNSPSTTGPVLAEVVHLRAATEEDLAKYTGQLQGRIVVMQPVRAVRLLDGRVVLRMTEKEWTEAMTPPPPPAEAAPAGPSERARAAQQYAAAVQRFLVAEGVAALLERGSDGDLSAGGSDLSWQTQRADGGTIFPGSGGSRDPQAPTQVPSATLAVEHYNRIVRLLERGVPVKMEVNIQTRFHPETDPAGNAINTIAEIPGTDLANELVVIGAHLDSYPYASGATDNATGSAAMMEAVRVIRALGLKPRRTIRVALWAGEEQGLLGSRAYVRRHFLDEDGKPTTAHANLAAYFNLDNGTGRILGIWGQGNAGAITLFQQWGESVGDLGFRAASPRSVGSTDHSSFENAGLPGFQFIQERLEYNSRTHHSNMDTFDHVQPDDLKQQGAVAAVFAWYAANWPEKLPRKTP